MHWPQEGFSADDQEEAVENTPLQLNAALQDLRDLRASLKLPQQGSRKSVAKMHLQLHFAQLLPAPIGPYCTQVSGPISIQEGLRRNQLHAWSCHICRMVVLQNVPGRPWWRLFTDAR